MDARPNDMPLVFVIDDDPRVRESLQVLLASAGWRAETFARAADFLACARPRVPSCLVLDLFLPDINGLELQERVARDRNELPIVFVAETGDVPSAVRAMKAGAVDFLTKPYHEGPLLDAIASAIDRSRTTLANEAQTRGLHQCYSTLTPREREVMALVTAGLLNKQVGARLGISEITVKAHRGRVMRKMQARSLAGLVEMAARLGDVRRPLVDACVAPQDLRGLAERAQEGAAHALAAREAGLRGDRVDGVPALFDHQARRFQAQVLDRLGR